jgi:signal transduction histidine kinase
MVMLSRLDEMNGNVPLTDLDLSELSNKVVENYRSRADKEEKSLSADIDHDIHIQGDREMLETAISLVIDNAFKYSSAKGMIDISLKKTGKGSKQKAILTIKNSVDSIVPGKHDKYFERFYRSDSSRNSDTGGAGIGLSVVKACMDCMGTVEAESLSDKDFQIIFSFPGHARSH